ncbi:HD domain-containing protein [Candidatus Ruminimicrobium bovinum]|uniref:HD domain-containing protein n=1 Tax=Candidatus Ruminimicrobium bovinum TaxID=3242779 RepID=UPI0039B9BE3A
MNIKELKLSNVTLKDVKKNEMFDSFIQAANDYLGAIGYTEHGYRHVSLVSSVAENILRSLDYPKRLQELAAIAGYVHDIGNVVNRQSHGQSAGLISMHILRYIGFTPDEVALVVSAVGNHEENIGEPVNPVAAALILADKSDVHKTRVRNANAGSFDIHDRVNYAVDRSFLDVNKKKKTISLHLNIDTKISQVIEYFEIFMDRMTMCREAAKYLNCKFELIINERKLL